MKATVYDIDHINKYDSDHRFQRLCRSTFWSCLESNKPLSSMPTPAAHCVAPPRCKKETPKPSDEPCALLHEEETPVPEAKIPLPDSTPNLTNVEGEKTKPEILDPAGMARSAISDLVVMCRALPDLDTFQLGRIPIVSSPV